ncbi:MAG TPA: exosome complex RNA-binding protein Rrp4 [Candidatus Nanoarchaeia archaeon]|nr:exosome complex RNA-binding protein Rrp4 [Candidatus Nanoarchaeia archaeon]
MKKQKEEINEEENVDLEISKDNNIGDVEEKTKEERKVVVPGEIITSGEDYLPGEGTRRIGLNIIAQRYGLIEQSGKLFKVIPLSGVFIPRRGNVIIGQILDISFNGWMTDINAPYSSFLPVGEVPRFIDKNSLGEFLDIGEFFSAKIVGVKQKGIDLSLDSKGLGRLEDGIIVFINPNKVPRVIGKEGSMIKIIKDETNCRIVVGQNGVVWVRGDNIEDELFAKKAILYVAENSYLNGLTERVQEFIKKEKNNGGRK